MDPTQTLIELLDVLQDLEVEFEEDNESSEVDELRQAAADKCDELKRWLTELRGFPPKVSEIDLND